MALFFVHISDFSYSKRVSTVNVFFFCAFWDFQRELERDLGVTEGKYVKLLNFRGTKRWCYGINHTRNPNPKLQ